MKRDLYKSERHFALDRAFVDTQQQPAPRHPLDVPQDLPLTVRNLKWAIVIVVGTAAVSALFPWGILS